WFKNDDWLMKQRKVLETDLDIDLNDEQGWIMKKRWINVDENMGISMIGRVKTFSLSTITALSKDDSTCFGAV
ncbi:18136_t:CDS:2, partial [Acaulospora morrowiae]